MDFSGKSLCILGCGYVGEAVARAALQGGMTVTALTRNPEKAAALRELGLAKVVVTELDKDDWHGELSPEQDFVLNCVSSAGGGLDGYRKSYVDGQRSVLRWAAAAGTIGTLVYTGVTSVYAYYDGELVTEDDVTEAQSPSGEILLEAEKVLFDKPHPGIERAMVLRLGGIYGPTRHHLLDQLRRGETTFAGRGDFVVNYIHRDDIVSAVFACFGAPESIGDRAYNVVDGHYPSKAEIVEWLAAQLGMSKPDFDPDAQTARAGVRQGPQGKMPNRRVDTTRIRKELGWSPKYVDFREGYRELL